MQLRDPLLRDPILRDPILRDPLLSEDGLAALDGQDDGEHHEQHADDQLQHRGGIHRAGRQKADLAHTVSASEVSVTTIMNAMGK